jgi:peroxiredoxin
MQTLRPAGAFWFLAVSVVGVVLAGQEPTTKPASPGPKAGAEGATAASAGVKIAQDAADFALDDCNGKPEKLAGYKDKVVVLVWANKDCPVFRPCVPDIKELHKKYAAKGVVWLGIDSTAGHTPEQNVEFVKQTELTLPILMDLDGKVARAYGAKTTPHVFVINKGKLVYMGALHNNPSHNLAAGDVRNYVDEALTAVLAGKDVPLAETTPWGCGVKYREEKK